MSEFTDDCVHCGSAIEFEKSLVGGVFDYWFSDGDEFICSCCGLKISYLPMRRVFTDFVNVRMITAPNVVNTKSGA